MATTIIRPISDYSISNWKNSDDGTTNLYSYVDEETLSLLDYAYSVDPSTGKELLFNFSDITNGIINKITLYFTVVYSGGYDENGKKARIYINSTNYDYTPVLVSGNTFKVEIDTNPNTSTAFTVSDINSLIAGFFHSSGSSKAVRAELYQYYIEVDYSSTPPTITGVSIMTGVGSITF